MPLDKTAHKMPGMSPHKAVTAKVITESRYKGKVILLQAQNQSSLQEGQQAAHKK